MERVAGSFAKLSNDNAVFKIREVDDMAMVDASGYNYVVKLIVLIQISGFSKALFWPQKEKTIPLKNRDRNCSRAIGINNTAHIEM